jgi:ATP-dependent RNA helicase DDX49/DBP8
MLLKSILLSCRACQYLDFVLQELGRPAVSLHSHKAQSLRLSALHRFKSGQVPVLISTDVGSRGLDIPTVDLVINYDIPRCLYTSFICIRKYSLSTYFDEC